MARKKDILISFDKIKCALEAGYSLDEIATVLKKSKSGLIKHCNQSDLYITRTLTPLSMIKQTNLEIILDSANNSIDLEQTLFSE